MYDIRFFDCGMTRPMVPTCNFFTCEKVILQVLVPCLSVFVDIVHRVNIQFIKKKLFSDFARVFGVFSLNFLYPEGFCSPQLQPCFYLFSFRPTVLTPKFNILSLKRVR